MIILNFKNWLLNEVSRQDAEWAKSHSEGRGIFDGHKRVMLPLNEEDPGVKEIEQFIEIGMYRIPGISDYHYDRNTGMLQLGKLKIKLGKYINDPKNGFSDAAKDWWQKNPNPVEFLDELMKKKSYSIIISNDPLDVLRMGDFKSLPNKSGGRSCHGPGCSHYDHSKQEAEKGGMIAYVVETPNNIDLSSDEVFLDDDRKIDGLKPISRLRIRKFENHDGDVIYVPEIRDYGLGIPGFYKVVRNFLIKKFGHGDLSEDTYSDWTLKGGNYSDTNKEALFDNFLEGDYEEKEGGYEEVTDDEDLRQNMAIEADSLVNEEYRKLKNNFKVHYRFTDDGAGTTTTQLTYSADFFLRLFVKEDQIIFDPEWGNDKKTIHLNTIDILSEIFEHTILNLHKGANIDHKDDLVVTKDDQRGKQTSLGLYQQQNGFYLLELKTTIKSSGQHYDVDGLREFCSQLDNLKDELPQIQHDLLKSLVGMGILKKHPIVSMHENGIEDDGEWNDNKSAASIQFANNNGYYNSEEDDYYGTGKLNPKKDGIPYLNKFKFKLKDLVPVGQYPKEDIKDFVLSGQYRKLEDDLFEWLIYCINKVCSTNLQLPNYTTSYDWHLIPKSKLNVTSTPYYSPYSSNGAPPPENLGIDGDIELEIGTSADPDFAKTVMQAYQLYRGKNHKQIVEMMKEVFERIVLKKFSTDRFNRPLNHSILPINASLPKKPTI